jgi:hypothetical protein
VATEVYLTPRAGGTAPPEQMPDLPYRSVLLSSAGQNRQVTFLNTGPGLRSLPCVLRVLGRSGDRRIPLPPL